ncbi:undecaprenyl-phosphate glucose phosphotransferase [bacterium]|nr:undecaprenyl-phosphate glucose phosphotransferase [bacterium]
MLKKNAQLFEALFVATDLFVVSLAWIFAYWLRFLSGWIAIDKGIPPFVDYVKMLIFVWLIWAYVYRQFKLYQPTRGKRRIVEIFKLVRANLFAVLLLLAFTYLFREKSEPFSRAVFVIFIGLSITLSIFSRMLIRTILRVLRSSGYNLRYALIVGSEALAQKVARSMLMHREYGIELLGCLDRNAEIEGQYPEQKRSARGFRVIGSYADLPKIISQGKVDLVLVALPLEDHAETETILSSLGDSIVDVKIVPDFHQFVQLGSEVEEFDGLPVVSVTSTPLSGINRVTKRMFDTILSLGLMAFFSPLFLLIALMVKFSSKGPIFYSQTRVGLDGQEFKIYKFRSMRIDAERTGAQFASKSDPRTTFIGRMLRKSNLDELPQLLNVFRGEMSLVGPRPERPEFIEEFRKRIPRYMLRHKVQAGMTGWAQVHGWRGNTSIDKRIEHDLFYIENWSLWLDLKILLLTLIRSFRDKNAY